MSIFIVTSGTSVYVNLQTVRRGEFSRAPSERLASALEELSKGGHLASILASVAEVSVKPRSPEGCSPLDPDQAARFLDAVESACDSGGETALLPPAALMSVAAELSSLFADGAPLPEAGYDEIWMMSSDTRAGFESAISVALLLGGPIRVDLGGDTRELTGFRSQGAFDTRVVPIPGLDTGRPGEFADACDGIAAMLRQAVAAADTGVDGSRVVLHMTGGYKVAIPLITQIANHLEPADAPIEAWANHDLTSVAIRVPIQKQGVAPELRLDLEAAARGEDPPSGNWEGYAYSYRYDTRRWQLTPLGRALRRLAV